MLKRALKREAIAETKRLNLFRFSALDAKGFYQLNNDPDVIRYTGDKAFVDINEALSFIENYDHYDKYDFGRWSIYLNGGSQYIGFCGLRYSVDKNEVDIGFRIMKRHWGKGYATESARKVLKLAFERYQLDQVVANTMVDNFASQAVIKKLNMQQYGSFIQDGKQWLKYCITN